MKRIAANWRVLVVALGAAFLIWHWRTSVTVLPDERVVVAGAARNYRLVVPRRMPKPTPVVFAFHGIGDSTDGMAGYSKFDRLAANEGFLLVYPAARKGMWATMEVGDGSIDENADVAFFDALVEQLSRQFDVDRNRVYVVGMSNGASFAQLLSNVRPDEIAAVASHSGPEPRERGPDGKRPPIMLLVGEDDFAHSAMRSDAERYRSQGRITEFVSIPGLGHAWSPKHNSQIWRFLSQYAAAGER